MPPLQINGQLPFSAGAAGFDFTGSPQGLANSYTGAYHSALGMNESNYNNIMKGFQGTMAAQTSAQDAISGGYSKLYNDVLGGIQGVGASQAQAIKDAYTAQSGAAAQDLVSRGLGNTTVADSVQRGLSLDQSKANIALSNQIAQLNAGYQSNLGMAGLNFGNQANMQNTALANQQLGFMNSVSAGYPNADLYARLAQQYGMGQQAGADRAFAGQGFDQLQRAGFAGAGRGTTGYTPGGGVLGGPSPGLFGPGGGGGPGLGSSGAASSFVGTPGNGLGVGEAVSVGGGASGYSGSDFDINPWGNPFAPAYDEAGTGVVPPNGQDPTLALMAGVGGAGLQAYGYSPPPPIGQFFGYGNRVPPAGLTEETY